MVWNQSEDQSPPTRWMYSKYKGADYAKQCSTYIISARKMQVVAKSCKNAISGLIKITYLSFKPPCPKHKVVPSPTPSKSLIYPVNLHLNCLISHFGNEKQKCWIQWSIGRVSSTPCRSKLAMKTKIVFFFAANKQFHKWSLASTILTLRLLKGCIWLRSQNGDNIKIKLILTFFLALDLRSSYEKYIVKVSAM